MAVCYLYTKTTAYFPRTPQRHIIPNNNTNDPQGAILEQSSSSSASSCGLVEWVVFLISFVVTIVRHHRRPGVGPSVTMYSYRSSMTTTHRVDPHPSTRKHHGTGRRWRKSFQPWAHFPPRHSSDELENTLVVWWVMNNDIR